MLALRHERSGTLMESWGRDAGGAYIHVFIQHLVTQTQTL